VPAVPNQSGFEPWWAACTVWGVVNAVNVLQAAGFLSRIPTGSMAVNHFLGYAIVVLAVPSTVALVAFVRAGAGWLYWAGPILFLAFVSLMVVVDYARPVEFRSPMRYEVLVPYLGLFFGAILFMGLPMYRLNRQLWLVTVATTVLLLGAMGAAMRKGVG
jgi:hypothetical protein